MLITCVNTFCFLAGLPTACLTIFLIARVPPNHPIAGIPGNAHSQAISIYTRLPGPGALGQKTSPHGNAGPSWQGPKIWYRKGPSKWTPHGLKKRSKGDQTVIQVWSKTESQKGDHFGRVDSEILNNSLSFSQDQAFQKRFTLGLRFGPLFGSKVFPKGS